MSIWVVILLSLVCAVLSCLSIFFNARLSKIESAEKEMSPELFRTLREGTETLQASLAAFEAASAERTAALKQASERLAVNMETFIQLQKERKLVTANEVRASLSCCAESIQEIAERTAALNRETSTVVEDFVKAAGGINIQPQNVGRIADLVSDIKMSFASFKNKALTDELSHLQSISLTLEKSITDSYAGIKETLEANAKSLNEGYEKFYSVCNRVTEMLGAFENIKDFANEETPA